MWLELIAINALLLHLYMCPFTKVEESFNIQAIHDVMNHGLEVNKYDHLEFPGVVPRSFLGPLVVGALSKPFERSSNNKFFQQVLARLILGHLSLLSFFVFCKAVETRFGPNVKKFLILITVSQFHFIFYASRPLPNVFALCLVLLALSCWLYQRHKLFIWLAGASIILFRFDLIMFLGLVFLQEVACHRVKIVSSILTTVIAGIVLLGLTVSVDSYFWQRTLWPEGEVMWFNIVLNKSHEYGTLPFLWYFYSALPRALLSSLLLVPLGMYLDRRMISLLWPAFGYLFLFSILPHKELRFIIYTFPVFNTAAACAMAYLWKGRRKSILRKLMAWSVLGTLVVNMIGTGLFLTISRHNYPGGYAMKKLHELERDDDVHVHIDVLSAQTGVTRFTQIKPNWIYNKTENLRPGGPEMLGYSHLLIGANGVNDEALKLYSTSHKIMTSVTAFDRIQFDYKEFPPLKIILKKKCFVLKKRR